jgi:hypothetical protein
MAQEPLPEPQITQDQFDLWLNHPVTQAYLKCLEWKRLDEVEASGTGKLVDSSNADLTHGMIHRSLGRQDAFRSAHVPWDMLTFYEMIFIPEEEGEEDGGS